MTRAPPRGGKGKTISGLQRLQSANGLCHRSIRIPARPIADG